VLIGVGFLGIIHAGGLLSNCFSRGKPVNHQATSERADALADESPWVHVEWLEDPVEENQLEASLDGLANESAIQGASKVLSLPKEESEAAAAPGPEIPRTAEWYYALDKKKVGPITLEELGRLLRAGQLQSTTMIHRQGEPKWVELARALAEVASSSERAKREG
jgi:hypothetical protein